jgi:hypothetical protein
MRYGGLSERARRRALEIANDADLRIRAPQDFLKTELDYSRTTETSVATTEDPRLPIPGTLLVKRYRGKDIVVREAVKMYGSNALNEHLYHSSVLGETFEQPRRVEST